MAEVRTESSAPAGGSCGDVAWGGITFLTKKSRKYSCSTLDFFKLVAGLLCCAVLSRVSSLYVVSRARVQEVRGSEEHRVEKDYPTHAHQCDFLALDLKLG